MNEKRYLNINKELLDVVEKYGWTVGCTDCSENDVETEIGQYSPAGEDFSFVVYHDNTNVGFVDAVREAAEDFDKEEHVKMWIGSDTGGVPDIETLVEDAEVIKEMMETLAEALEDKLKNLQRLADKYIKLAENAIRCAKDYISNIGQDSDKAKKEHYFDAQYNIGRYTAYMDLLAEIDTEMFMEIHEDNEDDWNAITEGMEGIYKL